MEGAFAWVTALVEWFAKFIPRLQIVRTTHGMVKWRMGSEVTVHGPGLHFWWPLITEIIVWPTARQADELRAQILTTVDGKTVLIGGLIVYQVTDLKALIASTYDATATVQDIVLSALHDVCCQLTWEELQLQQRNGKLDTSMRREAKKLLDTYGIQVIKLTLTDLAPARVLKLVQSTSLGGS